MAAIAPQYSFFVLSHRPDIAVLLSSRFSFTNTRSSYRITMDSDRKSAVSSFYGGKSSFDRLNGDFPRGNVDLLSGGLPNSAGYNRRSYLDAGRQEPLKGGLDEEADTGFQ